MQGADIPIWKHRSFVHAHAHSRGVWLRPTCVTLYILNSLLLEPERQINASTTWRFIGFYIWLPCWPSRGQQVSHQKWIWGIHCAQMTSTQVRDPPWLWNPEQTSSEVQNRIISYPTKRTGGLQKITWSTGTSSSHLQLRYSDNTYGYPGDFSSAFSVTAITDAEPDVQA